MSIRSEPAYTYSEENPERQPTKFGLTVNRPFVNRRPSFNHPSFV